MEIVGPTLGAELVLAGWFADASYEAHLRSMPGWRYVNFQGRLSPEQVIKLYVESAAAVIPMMTVGNMEDARPNKLFECMGCGTPAILTYQDAWVPFVEAPGAGWLLRDQSPEGLAKVMQAVVQDPEEARKRGARARELIELSFNWEHEAAKLLKVYERLTAA
jgi:glycosyltransferase involved in cell wall biosynthesis